MPFIELDPPNKTATGTGVRVSLKDHGGLRVTLLGDALALVLPPDEQGEKRVTVLLDSDPAMPRLRIVTDKEGKFVLAKAPRGNAHMLRIGHRPEFGTGTFDAFDCTWEALEDLRGIDIDLPREMRRTQTTSVPGRQTSITLPAVGNAGGRT